MLTVQSCPHCSFLLETEDKHIAKDGSEASPSFVCKLPLLLFPFPLIWSVGVDAAPCQPTLPLAFSIHMT